MSTFLIGGGWNPAARELLYGPFLQEASNVAMGGSPDIACVVIDEGDRLDQFGRWKAALGATAQCEPRPVLVPLGTLLDVSMLGNADGVLVCGGLTPAYAAAIAPVATELRAWLNDRGVPYAGFSAGAAIASRRAVVGGWRASGRAVCPEDAGEEIDEITVVDGIGIVDITIEVHASQWGTLGRLVALVSDRRATRGVAIDEDTMLVIDGTAMSVVGLGVVHHIQPATNGVTIRHVQPGERFTLD